MWRDVEAVLRSWREAERRLTAAVPGSEDWRRALEDVERFRERYRALTAAAA